VMVNGRAELDASLRPVALDEHGRWIAFRTPSPGYGLLFRPELKPGMLEDMVLEEDREVPGDIGALIETARAEWAALQETTDRVVVALVQALDLMHERRKAPVFHLSVQR
jgi:GMP synthase (glutamine-hydrolysing)